MSEEHEEHFDPARYVTFRQLAIGVGSILLAVGGIAFTFWPSVQAVVEKEIADHEEHPHPGAVSRVEYEFLLQRVRILEETERKRRAGD